MAALGLIPLLNRLDALIEKIDKLLTALGVTIPTAPLKIAIEPTSVVTTTPKLSNRYKIITVSLAAALTDAPIGIKDLKPTTGYVPYVLITSIGGGFDYKINSKGADAITASLGEELADFEVEEIYITCGAVGGNAVFYVEYRVD